MDKIHLRVDTHVLFYKIKKDFIFMGISIHKMVENSECMYKG